MSQRSFSFAIFFSLLGIGAGVAGVVAGIALSVEFPRQLLQYRGLAVLGGGLLAVLCLSYSLRDLTQCLQLLWEVLTGSADPDREGVLKECVMLATRGRESEGQENKFYREIKPYLSNLMLQSGVELLIAGYSPEMIRNTLNTRRDQECLKHESAQKLIQSLMQASWMLGIAGAATGLLRTQFLKSADQLSLYLAGIAVPLVVGLLLALLVFYPLLRQLQVHQREWVNYLEMSICGVLLLQSRHHAHYLETVLRAYLPPAAPAAPLAGGVAGSRHVRQSDSASTTSTNSSNSANSPRSTFQAALQHVDDEPTAHASDADSAMLDEAQQNLSVRDLRQFRPVQRVNPPLSQQRSQPKPSPRQEPDLLDDDNREGRGRRTR